MMKKTTRNYLWVLLANVLLVGFVAVLWQTRLEAATPIKPVLQGSFEYVKIKPTPTPLPKASYLKNLETKASLADYKGEWVILNLWATWCGPCVVELPALQMLAATYTGKKVRVIAISVDESENVDTLKESIARAGLTKIAIAQNWDANGEIANKLWPEVLPSTYFINPEGQIFATLEGDAEWNSPDATAFVDSLLGSGVQSPTSTPKAEPVKQPEPQPAPLPAPLPVSR